MWEFLWELCQFFFMVGTLLTAVVNTASIKAHTKRIFRMECELWPAVDARMRKRHER
jgi:hypothetical protein